MITCQNCSYGNPDNSHNCLSCGTPLPVQAPRNGSGRTGGKAFPLPTVYNLKYGYREGVAKAHTIISIILCSLIAASGLIFGLVEIIDHPYNAEYYIMYVFLGPLAGFLIWDFRSILITPARNSVQIGKNTETQLHMMQANLAMLHELVVSNSDSSQQATQELIVQLLEAQNEANERMAEQTKTMNAILAAFGSAQQQGAADSERLAACLDALSSAEAENADSLKSCLGVINDSIASISVGILSRNDRALEDSELSYIPLSDAGSDDAASEDDEGFSAPEHDCPAPPQDETDDDTAEQPYYGDDGDNEEHDGDEASSGTEFSEQCVSISDDREASASRSGGADDYNFDDCEYTISGI